MANIIRDANGNAFRICDYIDKGSFSKVYTLEDCQTKTQFAGKFISKEKLQRYKIQHKVFDEIRIHQKLRHKNIVQFLTYINHQSHIIIVLEYCSKYSMVNIIHSMKSLSIAEAKYFMIQIVAAVEYLHMRHIVHRDLKLGNLFVNESFSIKLGDFGLAVAIEYQGQKRFSRCGTPNYIAPEVINGIGHGYEVDVWALGCILYTMLEGTPPFQDHNTASTYNNILCGSYICPPDMDPTARAFIVATLQLDPQVRPSVFQLAQTDFLVSKLIPSMPPVFSFNNENEIPSSIKRDRRTVSKNTLTQNIDNRIKETHNDCIISISNWLADIKNWKETAWGEFLSESCSIKPLIWVNAWIDYTNSYGFAYQLSNSNYGIIFNDHTRMFLNNEKQSIHYVKSDGTILECQSNSVPVVLKKKMDILLKCGKYMNEELLKAHELKEPTEPRTRTELFAWTRSDDKVAMFLTNGSVQVNFTDDHTKVIVCAQTKTVTVIESSVCMKNLKLGNLQLYGCSKNLKIKLMYVLKYIEKMV